MPRVTIEACDACWKKDQTVTDSSLEFSFDGKTWFLCDEHERKFAQQMVELLGDPGEVK